MCHLGLSTDIAWPEHMTCTWALNATRATALAPLHFLLQQICDGSSRQLLSPAQAPSSINTLSQGRVWWRRFSGHLNSHSVATGAGFGCSLLVPRAAKAETKNYCQDDDEDSPSNHGRQDDLAFPVLPALLLGYGLCGLVEGRRLEGNSKWTHSH